MTEFNPLAGWLEENFSEVSPRDFYRTIFPDGALEKRGEYVNGEYTGIIVAVTSQKTIDGKTKVKRYTLTNDLDTLDIVTASDDFCLCSPLTYAGKQRTAEHARMLYAIAVDVDKVLVAGVYPLGLANLWDRHIKLLKRIPQPTFIVSSGSGLHLYYVLDQPLPLFRDVARELQDYKRELTRIIWHDSIVNIKNPNEIQQEGIYQGFRMPGTITKNGGRVRAFKTGDRVTMDYLNEFVSSFYKAERAAKIKQRDKNKVTLKAASEKWPEWYERRIIRGEARGRWATNRRVYEWWKEKILSGATVGHRYYCVMMLAIYAQKCSRYDEKHNPNPVTREELEADAFSLLDFMEKMTDNDNNHFTNADIQEALEAFDIRWTTYPRDAVSYRTAIAITPNKRNGQGQQEHLEEARAIRDIRARRRGERWDANNGRKSKSLEVAAWRFEHPNGTKADCIRDTGMDKKTVYKHWNYKETKEAEASMYSKKLEAIYHKSLEGGQKELIDANKEAAGVLRECAEKNDRKSLPGRTLDIAANMLDLAARLMQMEDSPEREKLICEWVEKSALMQKMFGKKEG